MEVVLGIATIIGGLAALGYFAEKLAPQLGVGRAVRRLLHSRSNRAESKGARPMAASPSAPQTAIEVFFSYAHEDEKLRGDMMVMNRNDSILGSPSYHHQSFSGHCQVEFERCPK